MHSSSGAVHYAPVPRSVHERYVLGASLPFTPLLFLRHDGLASTQKLIGRPNSQTNQTYTWVERDVHRDRAWLTHIANFELGSSRTQSGAALSTSAPVLKFEAIPRSATSQPEPRDQRAATSRKDSHVMATPTLPDS